MKPKSEPKTKSRDENEKRFYQFATALIAVPKKELDRELSKHERAKPKKNSGPKTS